MDKIEVGQLMGFTMPAPGYLFGAILFGIIGIAAFRYGKKVSNFGMMLIALGLMVYPYFISSTWQLYLIGVGLCGALYWFRHP